MVEGQTGHWKSVHLAEVQHQKTFPKIQFFHFVHILVQVLLSVVNKVDVRARHKIHQSIYFNSEVVIVLLTIFLIVIISSSTYIVVI